MIWYLVTITALALFFYIAVPGLGAVLVRRRWRHFRTRIIGLTECPTISYGAVEQATSGYLGRYRFFGALEAIQDGDTIWINDGDTSVSADLRGVSVYLLPSSDTERDGVFERNLEVLPDDAAHQLPWSKVSALPQGTKMLVSGALYRERGHPLFRSTRDLPLTIVLFDGEERTVLRRAIWSGRQHNEYWNPFTLISLLTGATLLLLLAYNFARIPMLRLPAIYTLIAGSAPLLPFVPPGIGLFFLYRTFWRKARGRRGERDLLNLPARLIPPVGTERPTVFQLPDGETYQCIVVSSLDEARTLAPSARVRTSSTANPNTADEYSVFGVPADRDGLAVPSDPLAEHIIVPGDPRQTAKSVGSSARFYEIAAIFCFVLGFAANWLLLFSILGSNVR